jgi:hypothetical protein
MGNLLELLSFGWVTLSVLSLALMMLLASGLMQAGIEGVKFLLNSSHPDAPQFKWENVVWNILCKCSPIEAKNSVYSHGSKWAVSNGLNDGYWDRSGNYTWNTSEHITAHTTFDTKESAVERAEYLKSKGVLKSPIVEYFLLYMFYMLCVDLTILALQHYFFPTVILLGIGTIVFGVRMLAGKVYSNTSKLGVHGKRISTLEEQTSKNKVEGEE